MPLQAQGHEQVDGEVDKRPLGVSASFDDIHGLLAVAVDDDLHFDFYLKDVEQCPNDSRNLRAQAGDAVLAVKVDVLGGEPTEEAAKVRALIVHG